MSILSTFFESYGQHFSQSSSRWWRYLTGSPTPSQPIRTTKLTGSNKPQTGYRPVERLLAASPLYCSDLRRTLFQFFSLDETICVPIHISKIFKDRRHIGNTCTRKDCPMV